MDSLEALLEISSRNHNHLCPRQILGARIGLAGMSALGYAEPPDGKRLLVILETDGCFADGVIAATRCTVGHRTLRVEDYGKTAATFVNASTGCAVRVAPALDIREQACARVPEEPRHYFAQLKAYRILPDQQLLTIVEVELAVPVEQIVGRPGIRVDCAICGEEILNEREVQREGLVLCRACAGDAYYHETLALHNFEFDLRGA
jgi:formylmethanofuran dehydrogenase subunit E